MKGKPMAELKCKDGTIVKISDETEAELRKAFGPKPSYKDSALRVYIGNDVTWPIIIRIAEDCAMSDKVSRNVGDTKRFIVALEETVKYCEQHGLGL